MIALQLDAQTITVIVAVIALIYNALSFRRTSTKDKTEFTSAYTMLKSDVLHIRQTTDEIKTVVRDVSADVSTLRTKVAELEKGLEYAHKRIDELMKG